MSRSSHYPSSDSWRDRAQWVPLILFPLLALFPPETRGWSMAAGAALIVVLALVAWRDGERTAEWTLLLAAAALAIPAARVALAPGAAVWPLAMLLVAAGAGISVALLRRPQQYGEAVCRVLAVSGGLVSLHALYQRLWDFQQLTAVVAADPNLPDREAMLIRLEQGRAFAAFSTPAALGCFLCLAAPLSLVLALRRRGIWRGVWIAVLATQLAGLLAAASATAAAALLAALVLAALLWRIGGRAGWIALVLALLLLASVAVLRGPEVWSGSHPNSPWRLRAGNFVAAWSMARDHPWAGVGPGGFAESYPAYRKPGGNETRHVHNLPLELYAELGIPAGTLVSLVFFVVFLTPLIRTRRDSDPTRRGVAVGLAAFALHNTADFTAFLPSLLWTAALLRGVVARPAEEDDAQPAREAPLRALAGAGLAAVLLSALVAAASGISDDARSGSRFAAYRGELEQAERLARRAAAWAPWDPDAALLYARAATFGPPLAQASQERRELALDRAEVAVRLSPVRPAVRRHRAEIRLGLGDYPGAHADMVAASRLSPGRKIYAQERERLERSTRDAIERAGAQP